MDHTRTKILFVITKSNYGGAQRYVYDLATSLKDRYDVVVALGGDGILSTMLTDQHIKVCPLGNLTRDVSVKAEWQSFMEMYHLLRAEKPNILHLNSSKAGLLGALAGRCARVPHIVFTAHAWAWNEERPLWQRFPITLLHWLTVILSHRTITVSNSIYDQMARYPLTRRRMRVIHPGITPPPRIDRDQARAQFVERIDELREKKNLLWITTVGELHPVKGHLTMLGAFEKLLTTQRESIYVIVGSGDFEKTLRAYVAKRDLTHQVFFTGHIQGVASLLSAFDLFVLPSLSEAFGYVLLEAGAAGVPIIASDVGGISEIIAPDGGTLVPPHDEPLLLDAIATLLSSKDKGGTKAFVLSARVHEYFTKERMLEETTALYEDLRGQD